MDREAEFDVMLKGIARKVCQSKGCTDLLSLVGHLSPYGFDRFMVFFEKEVKDLARLAKKRPNRG